jgi:hypothetical protein
MSYVVDDEDEDEEEFSFENNNNNSNNNNKNVIKEDIKSKTPVSVAKLDNRLGNKKEVNKKENDKIKKSKEIKEVKSKLKSKPSKKEVISLSSDDEFEIKTDIDEEIERKSSRRNSIKKISYADVSSDIEDEEDESDIEITKKRKISKINNKNDNSKKLMKKTVSSNKNQVIDLQSSS